MHKGYFRKQIFIPQDHGSWVFILSPLLVGLLAGENFTPASFHLVMAALAGFFIRQPLIIAVKVWSGRRAKNDLPAAYFWIALYGCVILIATIGLVAQWVYLPFLSRTAQHPRICMAFVADQQA